MQCQVFRLYKEHWLPIKSKVEMWVRSGWTRWEDEKPEWFSDIWKASVPKEMIPKKDDEGEEIDVRSSMSFRDSEDAVFVQGGGRRKSLINQVRQGKRESAKIMPEPRKQIDVEDFKRELKRRVLRRGSVKL